MFQVQYTAARYHQNQKGGIAMKAIPNYLLVALLLLSLSLMTGCEATDVPTAPEATPAFAAKSGTNCVTPPSGLVSWWPGDGNANDI